MDKKLSSVIKEPLFLFITAGVVLFVLYTALNNYLDRDENIVVVTKADIDFVEQTWASRMNRLPTPSERQGMIDKMVKDRVMYKTALEMGLDKNDKVVMGRMAQKLKYIGNDLIRSPEPSEQDLVTYYEENKEKYIPEEVISITHIFFNPDKREDETLKDADKALQALRLKGDFDGEVSGYGDSFMLQNYYPNRSELEIRKLFGIGFTESVFELEPGKWHGPVLSGYGTHLVYVHSHQQSDVPSFVDVRDVVKSDWMTDMQKKLNERYIEGLMARYEIVFEETAQN